jgi:hypothetical protein
VNEYQGLNLPELLELLQPVVLPEPVPMLPVTAGWWVLAGWLLAVLLIVAWRWRIRWRADGYRRDAQAELDRLLQRSDLDDAKLAGAIAALVKRTALAVYPRATVAGLTGSDWAAFLESSCRHDPQVMAAAQAIAWAAYRGDIDPAPLVAPARRWIALHRV